MRDIAFGVAWGYAIVIIVAGVGYIFSLLLDRLDSYLKSRSKPDLRKFVFYDGDDHSFALYRSSSAEALIDVLLPVFHKIDYWLIYEVTDEHNLDTWRFITSDSTFQMDFPHLRGGL